MKLEIPGLDALVLESRRVLVRVDFNVPLDPDGTITDDTRIRAALPTIDAILERGGKPVLMSHLGRPKAVDDKFRLDPVAKRLEELSGRKVVKLDESTGPEVEKRVRSAPEGSICLLENVRFNAGETKGDVELARRYAALADVFVNDAFGSSHRDHSSVSGVARLLPSAGGLLLQREVEAFRRVLEHPEAPFVAILGGAKVSDKLPVIRNLLSRVDRILIGGGMAYTFLAVRGFQVGSSLVQEDQRELVRETLKLAESGRAEILLPSDHVAAERFEETAPARTIDREDIPEGWMGLDIGPATRRAFAEAISAARTVVWNGPMGVFEWEAFREGTAAVGRAVADCPGYTVVGGGDSVAAIELLGLGERIGHISTGGGASLELLEGRELPGITALDPSARS